MLGYDILKRNKSLEANDPDYKNYAQLLDIPGFLSFNAFKLFRHLETITSDNNEIKNLKILEIGVYCGRSLLGLGLINRGRKVIGVDPFYETFENSSAFEDEANYLKNNSNFQSRDSRLKKLAEKSESLGIKNNIEVKTTTQEKFLEIEIPEKYQLIYLDGEHTYKSLMFFLEKMDSILTQGGFLVIDDFLSFGFPGISEAVHTHRSYKKDIFPVCYGFNKAVFVYKPSETYLSQVINKISTFIADNKYKSHVSDNDKSLVIIE